MLYLIGLGVGSEKDISLRGVEILQECDAIYFEAFTNNWTGDIEAVADAAGKDVEILPREKVESDFLIEKAREKNIALLVPGDPLTATTHIQLMIDAKKQNVPVEVVHSSSVFTAVAETGLQLYKFGRTTTLPKATEKFNPKSPFEIIESNKKNDLHTLVLLDIGMTAREGLEQIEKNGFAGDRCVACCRLGTKEKIIRTGTVAELSRSKELDQSPSVIIIVGRTDHNEEGALRIWQ